jgi:hypothetical protein
MMGDLAMVSDVEVVARLKELVGDEQRLCAAMLMHLGEVEARELYLPAACSSMHVYCVRVLGMAEEVAWKRVRAARAARRFPAVFEAVADGRLNLTAVVVLTPHFTDANVMALVAEASGKTKAEIQVLVARMAPRPDMKPRIEKVAEQGALGMDPAPVDPAPVTRSRVTPLAPERFAVQVTVSAETKAKLERAQALLRHQVPTGDVAEVLDRALDALLDGIERRKLGKARKPRAAKASSSGRYVPRPVRRAVFARDGEQCSFVGHDGRRCDERGFLELDHVNPVARGGEASVDGTRVLCRQHNQYEARRVMGREAVEAGRRASEMEADLVGGLRRMGVTRPDAVRAVTESRGQGDTVEQRMRAALLVLGAIYQERRGASRTACDQEVKPVCTQ